MSVSLEIIEQKLTQNIKAKNQVAVDTLRSLKTRVQNEQIAKSSPLTEDEVIALVKSEVKRRKEAVESYQSAGRSEQAQKESEEIKVLEQFLPEQLSEQQLQEIIAQKVAEHGWLAADFGAAMGQLKKELGNSVDGAMLAKILKDKLN